jgi:hypothetical protein
MILIQKIIKDIIGLTAKRFNEKSCMNTNKCSYFEQDKEMYFFKFTSS